MIEHNNSRYKVANFAWTDKTDLRLITMRANNMPIDDMAKALGCDVLLIYRRLKVLNITDGFWTQRRDRILKTRYQELGNKELAMLVGCGMVYVGDRLAYLGLRRKRLAKKPTL